MLFVDIFLGKNIYKKMKDWGKEWERNKKKGRKEIMKGGRNGGRERKENIFQFGGILFIIHFVTVL